MPGVVVNTAVRSAPTTANVSPSSTFFVVGTAKRGPASTATLVDSLAEFEAIFGTYDSTATLHSQVQTYFEEGGSQAYVTRIAGTGATAGTKTLVNGASTVITLNAANVGTWSSGLTVSVTTASGVFAVNLFLDGDLVYTTGNVSSADAATLAINNSAVAALYATATTGAGQGAASPAAMAATAFSTGTAGTAPTDAQYVTGLDSFDVSLGSGAVAIPSKSSVTVNAGLVTHAVANNRIALIGLSSVTNADITAVTSAVAATRDADYAEYVAFYYPYVTIPGAGGTSLSISPEGYAAAKRSKSHNASGPWQAAAGVNSKADFVTGISTSVNQTFGNALDDAGVNAIRVIQNSIRIYGARSASRDTSNFRYITARDTLNYISAEATRTLEDLVFSTIDGRRSVFGRVEARLIAILEPMRSAGGLYEGFSVDGRQVDPGYSVEVSDNLNPVSQLANGVVHAKVGVRVSSTGDRIIVDVIKSNLTSSVV